MAQRSRSQKMDWDEHTCIRADIARPPAGAWLDVPSRAQTNARDTGRLTLIRPSSRYCRCRSCSHRYRHRARACHVDARGGRAAGSNVGGHHVVPLLGGGAGDGTSCAAAMPAAHQRLARRYLVARSRTIDGTSIWTVSPGRRLLCRDHHDHGVHESRTAACDGGDAGARSLRLPFLWRRRRRAPACSVAALRAPWPFSLDRPFIPSRPALFSVLPSVLSRKNGGQTAPGPRPALARPHSAN